MEITLQDLTLIAALGYTEISVCVPVSQSHEDLRAPIPSEYSVVCESIQVNLDLGSLIRSALCANRKQSGALTESDVAASASTDVPESVSAFILKALAVLRLAEISPNNLLCTIRQVEVNITDRTSPSRPESLCSLELNNFGTKLSDDYSHHSCAVSSEYPVVARKADVSLDSLGIRLSEGGDSNIVFQMVKLNGLKLGAEGILSADIATLDNIDGANVPQSSLCFRSTVNGESCGLEVTVSKVLKPWMVSCCLLYDQEVLNVQENSPPPVRDPNQIDGWSLMDYCEIDLDAHFKMMKTEVALISLERTCDVLPAGVPSISLSMGEISIYGHPVVSEEDLGVRAKADIQCSRLKASFFQMDSSTKFPFLCLDFARVYISPVATMMQSEVPADVEMEAEWIEVKWAPEVLHAIGGMIELGIFTLAPFLHESRCLVTGCEGADSHQGGWKVASSLKVPRMRQMADVAHDNLSPGEVIAFRCTTKRICVSFPYTYNGRHHVDCVTVDTFAMSSEATTGRLRISLLDAKAFPNQSMAGNESGIHVNSSNKPASFRRKSFTSRASRGRTVHLKPSFVADKAGHDTTIFAVDCFSLEENKVVGTHKTVVDLFVTGARIEWDVSTQLRIMELIRRITFSSWEMIYRVRCTYAIHCTPPDSIYNRPYGLNPPLNDINECLRYEELFSNLISASGDKLHRLHTTNLSVHAKLCDEVDIQFTVGVFAGDDLPEVWVFEDVSLQVNGLEMVSVGSVHVRHTVDKRDDYVFGEFEDMLRKRLSACERSTLTLDQSLADGVLVYLTKLQLRTSYDFPLQSHMSAIEAEFDPFKQELASAMTSFWRPQQELFYQYFLRTPVASHKQDIWLRLESVACECLGNPLEGWLERIYPVWIEELAEQELRAHMLDEHVATLKLTNAELLCDEAYDEMKHLLSEKNARMYIQKVKKLRSLSKEQGDENGYLVRVDVSQVSINAAFEEDIATSWEHIKKLDEASETLQNAFKAAGHDWEQFIPCYRLLVGVQIETAINDMIIRMRLFPTPLMSCSCLSVTGQVFMTALESGCDDSFKFDITAATRCFVDLLVDISNPVLYFNPGYVYALNELAGLALGMLPLAILEVDRCYKTTAADIVRRLIHGKVIVSVEDAGIRLLCGATSFESPDFLELVVHRTRIAYAYGLIDVDISRVTAKIEPGSLSHIAELSHLKLQTWLIWGCLGDPTVHYTYPIKFHGSQNSTVADKVLVITFSDHVKSGIIIQCDSHNLSNPYRKNPFEALQATELSIFISGKICPVDPENGDPNSNDGWSKRDMAARTAVVLYSKNVEWLISFGRVYKKIPMHPLPRCKCVKPNLPSIDISKIVKGVTVEDFELIGLDVALYASEKHPVGVRAFIDNTISCSGALLKNSHEVFKDLNINSSDSGPDTAVRRLSINVEGSRWVVHDVNVGAREIQVRVCTPESGSRGESLLTIKHVSLIVGGGTERVPIHDNSLMKLHSPPPMKRVTNAQPFTISSSANGVKERPKQSILEYFEIPHENPFSYRESDSDADGEIDICETPVVESKAGEDQNQVLSEFRRLGFLLGLLSNEVRVTVTMAALESLVDTAETWVQVVVASLPELFDTAEALTLIEHKGDEVLETDTIIEESDPSPKKFTSLAQDPKFSGICLQGGADTPVNRDESLRFEPTPYSNADTVRPTRRKSSKIVSELEPLGNKEAIMPPRTTTAKLTQAFIMVKFEDCQISVQDHLHKGSVLLALNAGTLQDAVSPDNSHERINLNVDGFQVFTAPLDVDVKSHAIWLKTLADGSYCPSSYGLLRQVIAPIPAHVTIWVDREKNLVRNKVKLDIPGIEVQVSPVSKDILEKLATTMTELINSKLAEKKVPSHSHVLHAYLREVEHQERSLHQLVELRKQLKWKIAALQWRQLCGWDYRMNERAMVAVSAAESARGLGFDIETSPLFRRRKMSSASVSSTTTSISMMGSTVTNRFEDEQFTDELQRLTQQYESLSELTPLTANEIQNHLKPNPLPNVDMEFALDRASLTISGENVDILRVQMGSLCFKMQLFEDHSGNFALTLQDLSVSNLCPATPYPDLLQAVYSRSWEGDDMFLRIDAEVAKPVGGITVVQHFEVNVHPIQVCITQEVIMQLVAFISPSDAINVAKEEQREEVRSQFLQARTASSSPSDGRVGSAIIKAVKVAGKAAAHPLSLGRTHRGDSDEELLSSSSRKAKASALHHIPEDPSHWIAKLTNLPESSELPFLTSDDGEHQHTESAERDINEMKDRAKNTILFKRIRLGAVEVVLTYKNKKSSVGNSNTHHLHLPHTAQPQALEDMRGFEVKTHALVYCDKTCSPMDLVLRIRRDILLDVLSQVGRNFTNIGNFLRDQFDPSRWAAFDALAPLKSLSTTVSSLTASHTGAVLPQAAQPESVHTTSSTDAKVKDTEEGSTASTSTSVRPSELLHEWQHGNPDLFTDYDADSSTPTTPTFADSAHPKQVKAKRSLSKLFSRKKSADSLPSPSTH
ncbi:unnamed protein product [Phytophthora lilii]|uniref:Unnamed protein product n=1 Tax=Phytophthora lilii TaxID=2077276 RepID=A0A9W6YJ34_9STRA|nr:unnamed protein product [Phytophthora lilii]